jgi:hypothetical protein
VVFERRVAEVLHQDAYWRVVYLPKASQIHVRYDNLIHGGSRRIRRKVARRSIVISYFVCGSNAFYDSRGVAAVLEAV